MKKLLLWLLENTIPIQRFKTGTKAIYSGLYRSGKEYIPLTKGERFPPTDGDYWVLVVSVS